MSRIRVLLMTLFIVVLAGSFVSQFVSAQPTITLSPANLLTGTRNTFYSDTIFASGGTPNYTFDYTGTLPLGVDLASNGVLSGLPSISGTFNITVTAEDSLGNTGERDFVLQIAPAAGDAVMSPAVLPDAVEGIEYTQAFTLTGGTPPYTFSYATGNPPPGIGIDDVTGTLSGTPSQVGVFNFSVSILDSNSLNSLQAFSLTVGEQPVGTVTVSPSTIPAGVVNELYTATTFSATSSADPTTYTFTLTGTLPNGMDFDNGVLSGTPTETGTFPITITATDDNDATNTGFRDYNLLILDEPPELVIDPPTLPNGTAFVAYPTTTLTATGGTGPFTFSLLLGDNLPTGLSLDGATGEISGTPTSDGTYSFTIEVTNGTQNGLRTFSDVLIAPPVISIEPDIADGDLGDSYTINFTASGGLAPYTFIRQMGDFPTGLDLVGDTLSGTTTAAGTFAFVIQATDDDGNIGSRAYTVTITDPSVITISPTSVPAGTLGDPYVGAIFTTTGGVGAVTLSTTSPLPGGMSFLNGVLDGTPTESGTFPLTITATDSDTPANTASIEVSLVIDVPPPPTLTITPTSLAAGTIDTLYPDVTFSATGGTGAVLFSTSSALPNGMSLSAAGVLGGTPTESGTFPLTIMAMDTGAPPVSGTLDVTLVINAAPVTLVVSPTTLAAGTVGTLYPDVTFSATGGTGTVTFSTSSALPAGITFVNGVLGGTPTQSGSFPLTITAADSASPANTGSVNVTLEINPAPVTLVVSPTTLAAGTINTLYPDVTFSATGGTGAVTFSTTSALPTGITLSPTGVLGGTPTQSGSFPLTITATDSAAPTNTGSVNVTLVINAAPTAITLSPTSLPNGAVNTAYNQNVTASGGAGGFTYSLTGTLPPGLTLNTSTGAITGAPTTAGSYNFTIIATDSTAATGSQAYSVTVNPAGGVVITLLPTSLPSGTVGTAYGQTIIASGGTAPYSYAVTGGTLPTGLTLTSAGVLSGTPTANGSFSFTVTATSATSAAGARSYTITIGAAVAPTVTPTPLPTPVPLPTAIPPTAVPLTGGVSDTVRAQAVRSGPYLGATLLTIIRPGTQYPVLARSNSEPGVTWYLIQTPLRQGWVSGRLFTIAFDPNLVPLQGSIFDQIDGAPDTGVTALTRTVLNVRVRPSIRTQRIEQIPFNMRVEVLGRTVQERNSFWVQVRYNGVVGWVSARWLWVSGNIRNVPVR